MIPKIIHYVWLGDDQKPLLVKKCLKSWQKKLPDYEIKLWNISNIPHNTWIDEALSVKKWAFVADYVRAWAIYNYGGIYLDTDVFVKKSFNEFLSNTYFTSIEYNEKKFFETKSNELLKKDGAKINPKSIVQGLTIQSAIFGAEKGSKYVKDMMDFYENLHFIKPDGSYYLDMIAPDIQAYILEKYGFKYQNKTTQCLNGGGACLYHKNICKQYKKCQQELLCHSLLQFFMEKLYTFAEICGKNKTFYKDDFASLKNYEIPHKDVA